jgi:rRNA pseudouridine-1189 N-methylase Emg1 (Nep1/Mra1 family)
MAYKDIALSSLVYRNEFDCFPVDAKLLEINKRSLTDSATHRAFILLFSEHEEKFGKRILAKQALPVSISMFPWGEKRRYAAFADGSVRNIEK